MVRTVWVMVGLVVLCGACGGEKEKPRSTPKFSAKESLAVVTGRVRMAEGYSLPRYAPQDMERKVLQVEAGPMPEICTPAKKTDRAPVTLTDAGFLGGIVVAASDFTGAQPRPPKIHEVAIEDCRLTPRTVVAAVGDTLRLRNNVDFPFMPTFGPSTSARTLMYGKERELVLDRGGVESVLCSFSAPCGRTDVMTLYHPVAALTDDEGHFRIDHFPVDQQVTLNAWHPLFDEVSISVRLGVGETKDVELVISPKPRFLNEEGKTGAKTDLSGTPLQRSVSAAEAPKPTPNAEAPKPTPEAESPQVVH